MAASGYTPVPAPGPVTEEAPIQQQQPAHLYPSVPPPAQPDPALQPSQQPAPVGYTMVAPPTDAASGGPPGYMPSGAPGGFQPQAYVPAPVAVQAPEVASGAMVERFCSSTYVAVVGD